MNRVPTKDRHNGRRLMLVFYCILTAYPAYLSAQSYSAVQYDTKNGLPSNTVYDISQDKDGFVWFATENGLSRFDGKNFKTFTTKDGLPDNSILKVHGDNQGRVFFTPFTHGIHYYQRDSFFRFNVPEKYRMDLSIVPYFINKQDKVILTGGADTYLIENDQLISLREKYMPGAKNLAFLRAADTIIVARSDSSFYFIHDSGKITTSPYNPASETAVVFDKNLQKRLLHLGQTSVSSLKEFISAEYIYGYSENYIDLFSSVTGNLAHRIKVNRLSDAFIDNENNLWISTLGNGVYRYPSFGFRSMRFDGKSEIFSILKTGDRVLAGTDISKIHNITSTRDDDGYTTTDLSSFLKISTNPVSHLTKRNRVYVLRAEKENVYIGTDAFLLKQTGTSAPIVVGIYPIKDMDIVDEEILTCTSYAALLLDKRSMQIKDTLLKQRTTCGILYQGDYYIGTLGGLIKINKSTKVITQLYSLFEPFAGRITALRRGLDNDLWIATSGSGLVHFKDGKIIRVIKEQDGLTSDICTSLHIDSAFVWLGTNKGLSRIGTSKGEMNITRFTTADGLGADFINTVFTADSNIYVGTAAGLTVFNKNRLTEQSVCILHVLQVSENNRTLPVTGNYSFPHNALNIQVNFTAISFKSAGDITYYYQLKGLDDNWNMTAANFVNFPTLQPASYTLLLKAVNKFGVESDTKMITITILPPWWQKWIFRLAVLLAIGLVILGIYWYNVRSIRRKEEMKREFEARFASLEQKALQAQMNPHFIFNALNSIQTFILNLDVEGANNYLTRFASLIRQTLENSMHPLITVASELKYLETYLGLEKLRFREKFRYDIQVDRSIDQNNTVLPGMLLQPYLENSIRHGVQHRKDNDGLISLTIRKEADNSILYTIMDNGVGRRKAAELRSSRHIEYQSRGTSINEKRIVAINNQFNTNIRVDTKDIIEDGKVAGTIVSVLIPQLQKTDVNR